MENEKINTKNVPIGIPTIQKSVPKSAGTTSTKNNMTGGNEKEKSSSSGMISTTGKKLFIDLIDLDEKLIPSQILIPAQSRLEIYLISMIFPPNKKKLK